MTASDVEYGRAFMATLLDLDVLLCVRSSNLDSPRLARVAREWWRLRRCRNVNASTAILKAGAMAYALRHAICAGREALPQRHLDAGGTSPIPPRVVLPSWLSLSWELHSSGEVSIDRAFFDVTPGASPCGNPIEIAVAYRLVTPP